MAGGTWGRGLSDGPVRVPPCLPGAVTSPLAPSAPEALAGISYNAVDGPTDRRSFHGLYVVQDGLPL